VNARRRRPAATPAAASAYWEDGKEDARIIVVTPGFQTVALDARTGSHPLVRRAGIVDMKRDLGRGADDPLAPIGSSSPAVIVNGVIVVGPALELGFRPPTMANVAGFVRGLRREDRRREVALPHDPAGRRAVCRDVGERVVAYTGNAGVWAPFSADDELGYVYLPVEAGTSDLYGGHRLGDNVYSSSLVCLDAEPARWCGTSS
jgi:quinoprotein glucose dehydrogenase